MVSGMKRNAENTKGTKDVPKRALALAIDLCTHCTCVLLQQHAQQRFRNALRLGRCLAARCTNVASYWFTSRFVPRTEPTE
jgi:hypothetical protein